MNETTVPDHDSKITNAYQRLLHLEYARYTDDGAILDQMDFYLDYSDLEDACPNEISPEALIAGEDSDLDTVHNDLIVEIGDNQYQTTHFDLIRRIADLRNLYAGQRMVMEPFLTLQEEAIPDFGAEEVGDVLSAISSVSSTVSDILSSVIEIDGYSSHQRQVIEDILNEDYRYHSISAPTAAGKSLAFSTPALANAIENVLEGNSGTRSLLVYPRNALARDQLEALIERVYKINDRIESEGDELIKIGIETGDTPKNEHVSPGRDQFFGQDCPRCDSELIYGADGRIRIQCSECSETFEFICGTKDQISDEEPEIILTNIYTIYNRLLRPDQVSRFESVEYVVLDEAHVYTNYLGGHLRYVLELLEKTAERSEPEPDVVFSSATISNPEEFVSDLASIEPSELSHVEYESVYDNRDTDSRILLRLYVAPPPNRSVETLNEGLAQIVNLWCHRNQYRAINFIDSIAEINKQKSFLQNTILDPDGNQGDEVVRHVFDEDSGERRDPSDPFAWTTLAPDAQIDNESTFRNWTTGELSRSIHNHYAGLSQQERNDTIQEFRETDGDYTFLMATSTLEYGIDLNEIAAVLQYKLPHGSKEGVIQRIGRAGRSSKTQHVGLGVVALSSKPTSMLYLYDPELRGELESTENLPPSRVGSTSGVHQQHILSAVLHERALNGQQTFHPGSGSLENVDDAIEFIRELREDIANLSYSSVRGMNGDVFETEKDRITAHLEVLDEDVEEPDNPGEVDPGEFIVELDELQSEINTVRSRFDNARKKLDRSQMPESEYEPLKDVVGGLERIQRNIRTLRDALRETWEQHSPAPLEHWEETHRDDLAEEINRLPEQSSLRSMLYTQLIPWVNREGGGFEKFEEDASVNVDKINSLVTDNSEELDRNVEGSLVSRLNRASAEADEILSFDIATLGKYQTVHQLEMSFNQSRYGTLSVFEALNEIMQNEIKFSALMSAPQPEFNLEVEAH